MCGYKASMASKKGAGAAKQVLKKKGAKKIDYPPYLKLRIPAGEASPAPPVGPALGQRSIQIPAFIKDFNEKTKDIKEGLPIPTEVFVNPDRSVRMVLYKPEVNYFLKQAAGIKKGRIKGGDEVSGMVSLKHIYEIAKIKQADDNFAGKTLYEICSNIIGTAHSLGIKVVRELNPEEYGQFLKGRNEFVQQCEQELEEARQAKLLRL